MSLFEQNGGEVYRIYRLENALFSLLKQENYSVLEKEKLRFGIQIILSEFNKLLIIYLIAFLLDCAVPTLVTHLTFLLLRQVCLGYHFNSLSVCIVWSMIAFPVTTKFLTLYTQNVSGTFLYGIFCILLLSIYTLAPKGTENQPIINNKHQVYLRKKISRRLIILIGVFYFSSLEFKILISYGVFLEVFLLILQTLKGDDSI
ncbi:accessory gene regulator ArgB-like protein [Ureibacillus sp. NPDC094379]